MKKSFRFLLFSLLILIPSVFSAYQYSLNDLLEKDRVCPNRPFFFHSYGLMTYGAHTNTFHLREVYLKYLDQWKDISFYVTLKGLKDTHIPETNYGSVLQNIELFDYGITFFLPFNTFFSLRGNSTYSKNFSTYLLIPPYHSHPENPGEFDNPPQYMKKSLNAPGTRFGFQNKMLTVAYCQGDWRHSTPLGPLIIFRPSTNLMLRGVLQVENDNPLDWAVSQYAFNGQISFEYSIDIYFSMLHLITDLSYYQKPSFSDRYTFRAEQALKRNNWTFALREIIVSDLPPLLEVSLLYQIYDTAHFGLQAANDGRYYIGTKLLF